MTLSRRALSHFYIVVGIAAWVLTSLHLPSYLSHGFFEGTRLFWVDALRGGTDAGKFLTVDILMLAMAAMIWMVIEARSRGMRFVSIYILVALFIGISLAFPLFLAARERQIARLRPEDAQLALHTSDCIWIGTLSLLSIAGSLMTLL